MNKKIFLHTFIAFTVFVVSWTPSQSASFNTDLKEGMISSDVLSLQQILNNDPQTLVSDVGPGSSGNETAYFGAKTKQAVIRFQEKYREEILSPLGLSLGTGIVGSKTREMLNRLFSNSDFSQTDQSGVLDPVLDYANRFPTISRVSPSEIADPANTQVTIFGTNFTKNNKVFLSIQGLESFFASSEDGVTLSLNLNTNFSNLLRQTIYSIPENIEGTARKQAIELLKKEFNSQGRDGVYVPAVLFVQNENGETNQVEISINIFKNEI